MKTIHLITFCCISFCATSQIFNDNLHVLYRNYPNKVNVIDLKSSDKLYLKGNGLVFQHLDSEWVVTVTEDINTTTIFVYNSKDELIYSKDFRIINTPEMNLYYGQAKEGGFINRQERYIFCRYDESFLFNRNLLNIESCEISFQGRVLTFTGNRIPDFAYDIIQKLPSNCSISVNCRVKMENGKEQIIFNKVFYTD